MECQSQTITDFVVRVSDRWADRFLDAVGALRSRGASITKISGESRVIAGAIESSRIAGLLRMPWVQGIVLGATRPAENSVMELPRSFRVREEPGPHERIMTRMSPASDDKKMNPSKLVVATPKDRPAPVRFGFIVIAVLALCLAATIVCPNIANKQWARPAQISLSSMLFCVAAMEATGLCRRETGMSAD